jgi:hypothetical protein
VKTAEVDEQKNEKKTWKSYQSVIWSKHRTKYLQHFINKHDTIVSN